VAAEGAPRARERFSDAGSPAGVRHERQGERLLARALIDTADELLMSARKYPAKKAFWLAFGGRSSHAVNQFNKSATEPLG
jgi:hypothetical protein